MKAIIQILIFVSFLFVPNFFVFAQEDLKEIDEELIELDQLGIINNDGTITPFGKNHQERLQMHAQQRAEIQQTGSSVYIDQSGDNNIAEWEQEGQNNSFSLKQDGNNNVHTGYLRGEDNLIKVLQKGNNIKLRQELEGNSIGLDVTQEGNGHELIHIEESGNSPEYQIHQQGDHGMKIKIEHERY